MPTTMILEALSAVDRLITARTERNLSSLATVGTYHFKHFTSTVGTTALAIFTIMLACTATLRATAGIFGKAFGTVKFLLTDGKSKFVATIATCQSSVRKQLIPSKIKLRQPEFEPWKPVPGEAVASIPIYTEIIKRFGEVVKDKHTAKQQRAQKHPPDYFTAQLSG